MKWDALTIMQHHTDELNKIEDQETFPGNRDGWGNFSGFKSVFPNDLFYQGIEPIGFHWLRHRKQALITS